jgi:hypothetical protein
MKKLNFRSSLVLLLPLTALTGCQQSGRAPVVSESAPAPSVGLSPNSPSSPVAAPDAESPLGTYRSARCFLDRTKTVARRDDTYALATFTFNADGTATSEYSYFSDSRCTGSLSSSPVRIDYAGFTSDEKVGDVRILVLRMPNGTVRNPRLYIPMIKSATGYAFSVDYLSSSSGPFVTMPQAGDVLDFENDPAANSVEFTRL